jgi:hypothetical protein
MTTVLATLRTFVAERNWSQFHDGKNLAMCLGSEVGELLAEYRWVASTEVERVSSEEPSRSRIVKELGDVGIAWILLCDRLGLDPIDTVNSKLEENRLAYPPESSRGRAERPSRS